MVLFSLILVCLIVCATVQGILVPVPKGTCELKFDSGTCDAYFPVYTYNAKKGGCVEAVYGGCGGNRNRFETKELCEILCLPENICSLPFDVGPCRGSIKVWTYNSSTGRCNKAFYGGCKGNSNRFKTKRKCEKYCKIDICKLKFEVGPCKAYIPVWTFNSATGSCEQTYYGGCKGNANRFKTKEECYSRCLL